MIYAPTAVYLLCVVTSTLCAGLLTRSYLRSGTQLLFWSALCFMMLALNNLLVVVDLVVLPAIDLSVYRNLVTFVGLGFLLYGFIWELDR